MRAVKIIWWICAVCIITYVIYAGKMYVQFSSVLAISAEWLCFCVCEHVISVAWWDTIWANLIVQSLCTILVLQNAGRVDLRSRVDDTRQESQISQIFWTLGLFYCIPNHVPFINSFWKSVEQSDWCFLLQSNPEQLVWRGIGIN